MLNEQTMKFIKEIADAVYVYSAMSKQEAESILKNNLGMKAAKFLDNGVIYVIYNNNQDAYLEFPLLSNTSSKPSTFSM